MVVNLVSNSQRLNLADFESSSRGVILARPDAAGTAIVYMGGEMIEIDASQAWFWTEEWQKLEAQADSDIANGRFESFDNIEDFIAALDD